MGKINYMEEFKDNAYVKKYIVPGYEKTVGTNNEGMWATRNIARYKFTDSNGIEQEIPLPVQLANLAQETREHFVTCAAAVSRGKDSVQNISNRFKSLLTEAAPNELNNIDGEGEAVLGVASRPLEFCPVIATFIIKDDNVYLENKGNNITSKYIKSKISFYNKIVKHSYVLAEETLEDNSVVINIASNLRCLLNAGYSLEDIPTMSVIGYYVKDNDTIEFCGETMDIKEIDNLELEQYDFKRVAIVSVEHALQNVNPEDLILDYLRGNFTTIDYEFFKAVKIKSPMFSWSQWPMTHTMLSKESQSDRVSAGNGYWLPIDIIDKINNTTDEEISKIIFSQEFVNIQSITTSDIPMATKEEFVLSTFLNGYSQEAVQQILKAAGYKREVWSRAPYYFKYKECVITGWDLDESPWMHTMLERNALPHLWKNWTQDVTTDICNVVSKCLSKYYLEDILYNANKASIDDIDIG